MDKATKIQESDDMSRPAEEVTEVELEMKSSNLKFKSFYLITGYKKKNKYLKKLI